MKQNSSQRRNSPSRLQTQLLPELPAGCTESRLASPRGGVTYSLKSLRVRMYRTWTERLQAAGHTYNAATITEMCVLRVLLSQGSHVTCARITPTHSASLETWLPAGAGEDPLAAVGTRGGLAAAIPSVLMGTHGAWVPSFKPTSTFLCYLKLPNEIRGHQGRLHLELLPS